MRGVFRRRPDTRVCALRPPVCVRGVCRLFDAADEKVPDMPTASAADDAGLSVAAIESGRGWRWWFYRSPHAVELLGCPRRQQQQQ